MTVVKQGLSTFSQGLSGRGGGGVNIKASIGKVYGIITTPNTPTPEMYKKYGGESAIGTIFIKEYDETSKNIESIDYSNPTSYITAQPLFPWLQDYPVVGELVLLTSPAPSIDTQKNKGNNTSLTIYYTSILNIWNSSQENAPAGKKLGETFTENPEIRRLLAFEGDRIIQGRKGNGIRFGSTVSLRSNLNEWSSVGNNGDPITVIVNGYVNSNNNSSVNVEGINKEKSSIYMTTSQKIPLTPGPLIQNPFLSPVPPNNYTSPQIILNSDRVTINSKKDEVLIYSKSHIELNTDNNILLNAGETIHLHINEKTPNSRILLGTSPKGEVPFEPVLLGGQTHDVLLEICNALTTLAGFLSSVVVPTTEGGVLVTGCNTSGEQLLADVYNIIGKLKNIQSNKVFTI